MTKLEVGSPAPDFDLPADGGSRLVLSALRGRKIVLFFYPKDDTSGCTAEAIDFDRLRPAFTAAGTDVIGISPDPPASHERFKTKHGLSLPLASDESRGTLDAYGVWVEKSMYGRRYMGVERTTILVDADGRIAHIWPKVKVAGHADQVLAAVKAL